MSEGPYSRLYHKLADEYPEVYDSSLLADYMRLLVAADQAHPTRARWAGYTTRRALNRLSEAGLVQVDGARYSVKGMDKERAERAAKARRAAQASHAPGSARSSASSSARADTPVLPSKEETSRDETSSSSEQAVDAFDTYYRLTMRIAKGGAAQWIGRLIDKYDEALVERAIVHAHRQDADPSTLLGRVEGLLDQRAFREEKQAEQARKDRAFREMEEQRQKAMSLTPEQEARVEENKRRVAEMLAAAGKEMS